MIKIYVGNVGSGKTLSCIRDIIVNPPPHKIYSNIIPKSKLAKKIITPIDNSMIVKKTLIKTVTKKDGTVEPQYKLELNVDFWKNIPKPCTVIIDEIHQVMNPRRSMSKVNIIMSDWLALLRRAIGSTTGEMGELIMITQLPRRIDVIAKEMAHQVRYHRMHYIKQCNRCWAQYQETNDTAEQLSRCPNCNNPYLQKKNLTIEVFHFNSFQSFEQWKEWGQNSYHMHYYVNDASDFFEHYDSFQWSNLLSDLYD